MPETEHPTGQTEALRERVKQMLRWGCGFDDVTDEDARMIVAEVTEDVQRRIAEALERDAYPVGMTSAEFVHGLDLTEGDR